MKQKFLIAVIALGCILQSCTTYKAYMAEASKNPITQKLPKMDLDWFSGGDVQGVNVDFVKNIVRNEINQNIISSEGQKQGRIEVSCDKIRLRQNLVLAYISGSTLFMANILGMPFTATTIDMELTFKIIDGSGNEIDSRRYTTSKKNYLGFYYGKDANVTVVEATKEITQKYRADMNLMSSNIIAKLNESVPSAPVYYAGGQATIIKKMPAIQSDVDINIPTTNKKIR